MDEKKCPVCNGKPGPFRLGACSPGCDVVMGDEPPIVEAMLMLLFAFALIGVFYWAVTA